MKQIKLLLTGFLCLVAVSVFSQNQDEYFWVGGGSPDPNDWTEASNWVYRPGGNGAPIPALSSPGSTSPTDNDAVFFDDFGGTITILDPLCVLNTSPITNLAKITMNESGVVFHQISDLYLRGANPFSGTLAPFNFPRGQIYLNAGTYRHDGFTRMHQPIFDATAGTWISEPGSEMRFFNGASGNSPNTFDSAIPISFDNFTMDFTGFNSQTTNFSNDLIVKGTFQLANNCNNPIMNGPGTIHLERNIAINSTANTFGTVPMEIDGIVDQTITGNQSLRGGNLLNVVVNKPSGILHFQEIVSIRHSWEHQNGTLDFDITGAHPEGAIFSMVGHLNTFGGMNISVKNFAMTSMGPANPDMITFDPGYVLTVENNLFFDAMTPCGDNQISSGGYILMDGQIDVLGDILLRNPASAITDNYRTTGGTTVIRMTGENEQYLISEVEEEHCRIPNLLLDKDDGNVYVMGKVTLAHSLTFAANNMADIIVNHNDDGYTGLSTPNNPSTINLTSPGRNVGLTSPTTLTEAQAWYENDTNLLVLSNNIQSPGFGTITGYANYHEFVVTGAGPNGYVRGPIKRNGRNNGLPITLPTGSETAYHPITLTAPNQEKSSFVVQYYEDPNYDPTTSGITLQNADFQNLVGHSDCEYWVVNQAVYLNKWYFDNSSPNEYIFAPASINLGLHWDFPTSCTEVVEECELRVGRHDDFVGPSLDQWVSEGRDPLLTNGTFSNGPSVLFTSPGPTQYGAFTFAFAEPLEVAVTVTAEDCSIPMSGSIDITASGGEPAYQFSIDGGNTFSNAGLFTGLIAGNYDVVVTDVYGCEYLETVLVPFDNTACDSCLNSGVTPNLSLTANGPMITVTDLSTGPVSYIQWSWGDGSPLQTGLPGETVSHTYLNGGIYEVCVITGTFLSGNICCYDTFCTKVEVPHEPCFGFAADLDVMANGNDPNGYDFTDLTVNSTVSIWDFGDGNTALGTGFGSVVSHTYANNQSYTAQLVSILHVDDTTCCIDTVNVQVGGEGTNPALKVFPNPALEELFIDLDNFDLQSTTVRLENLSGEVLQEIKGIQNEMIRIDIAGLSSGLYYIRTISPGRVEVKKFVRQ